MGLGQIIRQRREEMKLTLDEVSNKIGFSKPYLSTIETSKVKNPPSDDLLSKLEEVLEFEPGMLMHIAHLERMPSDLRQKYEKNEAELEKWRQIVKNVINKEVSPNKLGKLVSKKKLRMKQKKEPLAAGRLVPVINKVAAGYPTDFDDLDYPAGIADDYVRCPDLHDPQAFAARVVGDSMEPLYREGDIVVFSPNRMTENGDDCFIRFGEDGGTTFKRFYQDEEATIRLQPLNSKYPAETHPTDVITGVWPAVYRIERLKPW